MYRLFAPAVLAISLAACQHAAPPTHASITEFKADPTMLASGVTGRLCYGVENTSRIDLTPPVEKILPASHYCVDIVPKQTTTYTLTAYGPDGKTETKSTEVTVGPPQPRVADLTARPMSVKRGRQVTVCFKLENAKSVSAKPGKLDHKTNCLVDYPKKTTTYHVIAKGDDHEQDTGTVTVSVLR
jgi:hypothetical protein